MTIQRYNHIGLQMWMQDDGEYVKTADHIAVKDKLVEALEASERVRTFNYTRWPIAGGPDECEHGIAKGILIRECDLKTARAALAEFGGEA